MRHRWRGLVWLLVFIAPSLAGRHGVPSLALSAQQCAVQVSSLTPAGGTIVRDAMFVKATVASGCQLQSVTATIPNLAMPLTFYAQIGQWAATLPLDGLDRGSFVLTVTAVDVFGNGGAASVMLDHDALPVITIDTPEVGALARPVLHVTAACHDDDPGGCVSFQLLAGLTPSAPQYQLLSTTSSVDQESSLAAFDGKPLYLFFIATDSRSGVTSAGRRIFVESSPFLVESVRVPGVVLDDSATRTLFYDDSSQVSLFDKTTNQTTVLLAGTGYATQYGYLTPAGAMFVSGPASETSLSWRVYEWRGGSLIDHGLPNSADSLRVSGGYAIWTGNSDGICCQASLYLEDLPTGAVTTLENSVANTQNDVAANGDVAYWNYDYQIIRYRAGVKATLTSDTSVHNVSPVTDGINVAYLQVTNTGSTIASRLITPGGEVTLGQFGGQNTSAPSDYAVNAGWTAFTRPGLGGARNIWMRSPTGVETQETFFSDTSAVNRLNDDGRVAVTHGGRMLILRPGTAPFDIGGSWNERPSGAGNRWRNNTLFLPVGRSVLRLVSAAPGAPASLQAALQPGSGVQLTWTADPDARSYTIRRGTTSGGESLLAAGIEGTSFTDTAITSDPTYYYVVSGRNGFGESPPSSEVSVAVALPLQPAITAQPANRAVAVWKNTAFSVAAIGMPTPAYRWQVSADGTSWTDLGDAAPYGGVTTTTLTITAAAPSLTGTRYRVTVTNSLGSVTSAAAALIVAVPRLDFDGDLKSEIEVFRPSNGTWYVRNSAQDYNAATADAFQWGLPGDLPISGDFDGDGKSELAVFRPSTGTWFIRYSSQGYAVSGYQWFQWGLPGDIPIVGDFDGDGRTELAVYRPSNGTWYFRYSSQGYALNTPNSYQWGLPGDIPLVGDFDGDGRTELAVFRPANGTWYVRYSSLGYDVGGSAALQWGLSGDVPIAGDVDGDGRTDLVVWRPSNGTWYVRYSTLGYDPSNAGVFQWGLPGDIPAAADFDGDGRIDLVVWRPSNGTWYIRYSAQSYNVAAAIQWGLSEDRLVQ